MKKRLSFLIICFLSSALIAQSQTETQQTEEELSSSGLVQEETREAVRKVSAKRSIMILPTVNKSGAPAYYSELLTESLYQDSVQLGRFNVVDRDSLNLVLKEKSLQLSGLIPMADQASVATLVGADESFSLVITDYKLEEVNKNEGKYETITKENGETERVELEPEWVWQSSLSADWVHRDMGSATVLNRQGFSISSENKEKREAISSLDNSVNGLFISSLRGYFPIESYVAAVKDRSVVIRFGRDMGLMPGDKYWIYSQETTDKTYENAAAQLIIDEVFPVASVGTLRIIEDSVQPDMSVLEYDAADASLSFSYGLAPLRLDPLTLANLETFVQINDGSSNGFLPLSTWVQLEDFESSDREKASQLSFSVGGDSGVNDFEFQMSLLARNGIYGAKMLLGQRMNIVDRDKFYLGAKTLVGGAGTFFKFGEMKDGYYIPKDSVITSDDEISADINRSTSNTALFGSGVTMGGEISFDLGYNKGFKKRRFIEVGYAYYLPITQLTVYARDDDDNQVNLDNFFDTSKVDPVTFSGFFFNIHFQSLF